MLQWGPPILILATAVTLAVFMFVGCGDGGAAGGSAWEAGRSLRILFTGETLGELEPCDCAGQMAGGLPARGAYVKSVEQPHLLLDTGNVGRGAREWEVLRAEATLRGMAAMGADAVNVGEHELWLGAARLGELDEAFDLMVSANVSDDQGRAVAPRFRVFERAGVSAVVTGLAAEGPTYAGPGLVVRPPGEALAALLPDLLEAGDALIVLADLPATEVRSLAERFPEVTLILYRGRGDSQPPTLVNRTVVASIYGEARYIGDLSLRLDPGGEVSAQGEAVLLDRSVGEDAGVRQAAIAWYKDQIDGRQFDLAEDKPGWDRIRPRQAEPGNGYVGSQACTSCHAYQHERWSSARHARAMESLERVGYANSPECVVCHVVGYGASDGYTSMEATPHLANVGCESCHGPGHVLTDGDCAGVARPGDAATCRTCHHGKHHPDFQFDVHWARIDHTRPEAP